jgi:uncharacterized DUF497 family protein
MGRVTFDGTIVQWWRGETTQVLVRPDEETDRETRIRIIGARVATRRERKDYEEGA